MRYQFYPLDINITKGSSVKKQWRIVKKSQQINQKIQILRAIYKRYKYIMKNETCSDRILELVDKIILDDYFGNQINRKLFHNAVTSILTQSRSESMFTTKLYKKYNIQAMSWIQEETGIQNKGRDLLLETNLFLLNNVVKPLIKRYYIVVKKLKSYAFEFVKRPVFERFMARIYKIMERKKHMIPSEVHAVRGQLNIHPKSNYEGNEYRPVIIANKKDIDSKNKYKHFSKLLKKMVTEERISERCNLFQFWENLNDTESKKNSTLYGVKMDIQDAYGNVKIHVLANKIITSNLLDIEKKFLLDHIQNQYVILNKKTYKWNHGLLQGDNLSADFCELYITIKEKEILKHFVTDFIYRQADDYLFCTFTKSRLDLFEQTLSEIFPLNKEKSTRVGGEYQQELCFFGKVFNFHTRQVTQEHNFKNNPFRYRIKPINNISYQKYCINDNPLELKKAIVMSSTLYKSANHNFTQLDINYSFNTPQTVLINYFKGMVFVVIKFDLAVESLMEFHNSDEDTEYLIPIIIYTVKHYSSRIYKLLQKSSRNNCQYKIKLPVFENVARQAFILIFKRNSDFYLNIWTKLRWNESQILTYLENTTKCFPVIRRFSFQHSNYGEPGLSSSSDEFCDSQEKNIASVFRKLPAEFVDQHYSQESTI